MKLLTKPSLIKCLSVVSILIFVFSACQKAIKEPAATEEIQPAVARQDQGHLKQTKTFDASGAMKWHDLQLRLLWYDSRIYAGNPYLEAPTAFATYGLHGNRFFAYLGIGLYESVVPGMPSYQSLSGQLSQMPAMPSTEPGKAYHWAASANATLYYLTKNFFTRGFATNLAAIDSLYNALKSEYEQQTDAAVFDRSDAFGNEVAKRIFEWSKTDGASAACSYTLPPDPTNTKWSNTAPNPTAISFPCWGNNRLFVSGSTNNTASPLPPPYSIEPGSPYRLMVEEVYNLKPLSGSEEEATALYFNDIPGYGAGTHYQSVFSQVMHSENPQLDFYAEAEAKVGIALAEAQINCWKIKYTELVDRPTRYIRNVLGYTTWTSTIGIHPHPEFPSGHSQTGGAFAGAMTRIFGDNYPVTVHTYDHLGKPSRPYASFSAMADNIGMSRVYGGIHYKYTCVESKKQGWKIADNIISTVKFLKE
jgi:hypothetical protein